MKVLHVEDNVAWFNETILPELNEFCEVVDHAVHFSAATEKLEHNTYDYIIVDQSIPIDDSGSSPDISNGIRFADHVRDKSPGTPLLILTGQDRDEVTERYVEDQERVIFWDGQDRGLVKVRSKSRLLSALSLIQEAAKELSHVESIELDIEGSLSLKHLHKRVIKIFAKRNGAVAAKVEALGGGLSSSAVLRVTLINSSLQPFQHALAKIDRKTEVVKDASNYTNYIQKLPVGSFPTLLGRYFAGCADMQGVFYQFASDYSADYFDVLVQDHARAKIALEHVFQILDCWEQARMASSVQLRDIRRKLCSDQKFADLQEQFSDIDFEALERMQIQVYQSIQHGDLHGKNILLTDSGVQPILIDYGDIQEAPCVLDVVTLELSPYFHPDIADNFRPNPDYFEFWFDDSKYINNSPFPEIAKFLREKKQERAILNKGYVATVYAYALRQLTYKDTDHQTATSLVYAATKKLTQ
ncbi:hypothetical protein UB33_05735 [Photobacterium angustum]|uniref:response regulator n=1 Tax=Photobacterium angustum TaxID=661 RepID=UPI0005E249F2|nr:response regulator [Photobacterium angustum]KJF93405.1 hypothetical protein UB39_16000 [Photobacterium angustum]KJG07186.1 hypothetical protein UB33_05735 [Photobacterium angustum]PSV90403.1 response regulator [Photobacterium angustum]PSW83188.1 response regulator [Photobacterium angustum]